MEKTLLTIAIPTYNGGETLENALDSIINPIRAQKLKTKVIVSDNASTDDVHEICVRYKETYPDLFSFYRNETNLGYDLNVDNCMEKSESEYVWCFSDNEIITDEYAISKIEKFLALHAVDFLYLEHDADINLDSVKGCKDYFDDPDEFFQTIRFKSGLISNCVVNRQTWLSLDMKRYDQCLWIHMAYQIEALSPKREHHGAGVIWEELYAGQPGPQKWGKNGTFIDTGLFLCHIWEKMPELGYSRKTKKEADFCIKGGYPKNILMAKAKGYRFTLKKIVEMAKLFARYPSFWLWNLPEILIPGVFVRFSYNLLKKGRK